MTLEMSSPVSCTQKKPAHRTEPVWKDTENLVDRRGADEMSLQPVRSVILPLRHPAILLADRRPCIAIDVPLARAPRPTDLLTGNTIQTIGCGIHRKPGRAPLRCASVENSPCIVRCSPSRFPHLARHSVAPSVPRCIAPECRCKTLAYDPPQRRWPEHFHFRSVAQDVHHEFAIVAVGDFEQI